MTTLLDKLRATTQAAKEGKSDLYLAAIQKFTAALPELKAQIEKESLLRAEQCQSRLLLYWEHPTLEDVVTYRKGQIFVADEVTQLLKNMGLTQSSVRLAGCDPVDEPFVVITVEW